MEFLSQTYVALRGPTGAPQTASDTIGRLSDRLSPATLLADRRAAVLALKGLARDCKHDVGDRALPGLLEVLSSDAEVDGDIGKAVIETLQLLCDTEEGDVAVKELGFKHTDYVLANNKATHMLFALLGDQNFYTRFATLQYLSTLLQNRRQLVQGYFLKAPSGTASVVSVLEDSREIIRNEAITMVQSLISQSPDIQKVLAFEGAFEKLFNIVNQEGGVEGGAVTSGALTCIDGLLRFNSSNQSYFRETPLPPLLCSLLLFPVNLQIRDVAPQEFALQFWDAQKQTNASLVLGIMGMLVGSKGGSAQESSAFMRCLVEIALASNAPTPLKTQALRLLPGNLNFPLSEITLTPYMPVPETNGEEWDRLEPASALDALVELALHGEYNGLESGKRMKEGLELRTAAVAVFENFVRKEETRQAILQSMLPSEGSSGVSPVTPLLHALIAPPSTSATLDPAHVTSTHLATLLFSHLLRSSSRVKALARSITPTPASALPDPNAGAFFVPADGAPPPPVPQDDEDEPQALLQILSENLSLSLLSRSRADTSDRERREWDRLVVAYLSLLSQWLWEDPPSVREFLDAGGFGVLVEPINQTSELDTIVPALCTFLLGVCYEFDRQPGEITRATIYPILNRLSIDTLIGRMARLREDERFKAVGPDTIVLPYPSASYLQPSLKPEVDDEGEVWFDWAFVDFWKSNYCTFIFFSLRDISLIYSQIPSNGGFPLNLISCHRLQETSSLVIHEKLSEKTSTRELQLPPAIPPSAIAYAPSEGVSSDAATAYASFLNEFPEYRSTWILDTLRRTDYARLERTGETYVDFMGGALYPESLIKVHTDFLTRSVMGNTHSVSNSSSLSVKCADEARAAVLSFFRAPPEYTVVFTANASAALKLVGESFPFTGGSTYVLGNDAHNSVHGIREYATYRGARVCYIQSTPNGGFDTPSAKNLLLRNRPRSRELAPSLFALTGQSNISNSKNPLSMIDYAASLGYHTLLDAAAWVPTSNLSLKEHSVDAMAVSFYKMFGFPTGVGALVVKKSFLAQLKRPWFAGGNVDVVQVPGSIVTRAHEPHEQFEDGTINYLTLPAITDGLQFLSAYLPFLPLRLSSLLHYLINSLSLLRHDITGKPVVRILSRVPTRRLKSVGEQADTGSMVSLVFLSPTGDMIPNSFIEYSASKQCISLRTGCMCNPGAAAAILGIQEDMAKLYPGVTLKDFERIVGRELGVVRISLGLANNFQDAWKVVRFAAMIGNDKTRTSLWRRWKESTGSNVGEAI